VQLYRYFVSQSSKFCYLKVLCCFSTSAYYCSFRYRLSPDTFGCTVVDYIALCGLFLESCNRWNSWETNESGNVEPIHTFPQVFVMKHSYNSQIKYLFRVKINSSNTESSREFCTTCFQDGTAAVKTLKSNHLSSCSYMYFSTFGILTTFLFLLHMLLAECYYVKIHYLTLI